MNLLVEITLFSESSAGPVKKFLFKSVLFLVVSFRDVPFHHLL